MSLEDGTVPKRKKILKKQKQTHTDGGVSQVHKQSSDTAPNGQNQNNLGNKIKCTQSIYPEYKINIHESILIYMTEQINEERKANLLCRRISQSLCRCTALKVGEQNSLLLTCGLHTVTSFQRGQDGKGKVTVLVTKVSTNK